MKPHPKDLTERLDGLEQRFSDWIEESRGRVNELFEEIRLGTGFRSGDAATPREAAALEELSRLAQDAGSMTDQVTVLNRLLETAGRLADRAVLFVVRDGALKGWSAAGLEESVNPRTLAFSLKEDTLLAQAATRCDAVQATANDPAALAVARRLGSRPPAEMAAAPLWVRDRVAAVLYADGAEPSGWLAGSLAAAATIASLTLEALPLRAKHPRPVAESTGTRRADPIPQAASTQATGDPSGRPVARTARAVMAAHPPHDTSAGPSDPEGERVAEEARRFAHLLVSEIVLYNEAEIAEGRRRKDLYPRLKDDIDRSRRMYEQRIGQELSVGGDYFHEELVRELAGGDESALGMT